MKRRFLAVLVALSLGAGTDGAQADVNLGAPAELDRTINAFTRACIQAYGAGAFDAALLAKAGFAPDRKSFVKVGQRIKGSPNNQLMTLRYNANRRMCSGVISGAPISIRSVQPHLVDALAANGFRKAPSSNGRRIRFTNDTNVIELAGSSSNAFTSMVGFDLRLRK